MPWPPNLPGTILTASFASIARCPFRSSDSLHSNLENWPPWGKARARRGIVNQEVQISLLLISEATTQKEAATLIIF